MFLANPELMDQIKFDKLQEEHEREERASRAKTEVSPSLKGPRKYSPGSMGYMSSDESPAEDKKPQKSKLSSKFWGIINREMARPTKQGVMPSIRRINHMLNIYKAQLEIPDNAAEFLTSRMTPRYNNNNSTTNLSDSRFRDKRPSNYSALGKSIYKGKDIDPNIPTGEYEIDDGQMYFSFKKRMQIKTKNKKDKMALTTQTEPNMETMNNELDEVILMNRRAPSTSTKSVSNFDTVKSPFITTLPESRNTSRHGSRKFVFKSKREPGSGGGVIERLTRDFLPSSKKDEELNVDGKEFKSAKAKQLYLDKQQYGDSESFKREATKRIKQAKRDFYEKVHNAKPVVPESIKFTKDKRAKTYNVFMPEFDKVAKLSALEKENVFALNDNTKSLDTLREAPEQEVIRKFSKIINGNIVFMRKGLQEQGN